jgi:hypothetical protein
MNTDADWRDIPGFEGEYKLGWDGREAYVRSLDRTVIRGNGSPYRVRGRLMRFTTHRVTGLRTVKLATGQRGRHRCLYVHVLVRETFGA